MEGEGAASPFLGVDHQVFLVAEMAAAVKFWQAQLGLELTHRAEHEEQGIDQAFFPLADGTFVELLAPTNSTSPVARALEKHGEGLYVLAMKVAELEASTNTLIANGAKVLGQGTDRVLVVPNTPGEPMIQLWPISRPHRWRDEVGSGENDTCSP